MKPSHASNIHKSRKSNYPTSHVTYDVKPLIKMALVSKKSTEFCATTVTLLKLANSRHKRIKMQLNEKLENSSVEDFVAQLVAEKTYLHSQVRKPLGKYLNSGTAIKPDTHKNVS